VAVGLVGVGYVIDAVTHLWSKADSRIGVRRDNRILLFVKRRIHLRRG
jgi:hypothetical protein